jgi:hypothetical protein
VLSTDGNTAIMGALWRTSPRNPFAVFKIAFHVATNTGPPTWFKTTRLGMGQGASVWWTLSHSNTVHF